MLGFLDVAYASQLSPPSWVCASPARPSAPSFGLFTFGIWNDVILSLSLSISLTPSIGLIDFGVVGMDVQVGTYLFDI